MADLTRCTKCVTQLHYDAEKDDWTNEDGKPNCPQGGPHKLFVPKIEWSEFEDFLAEQ